MAGALPHRPWPPRMCLSSRSARLRGTRAPRARPSDLSCVLWRLMTQLRYCLNLQLPEPVLGLPVVRRCAWLNRQSLCLSTWWLPVARRVPWLKLQPFRKFVLWLSCACRTSSFPPVFDVLANANDFR